MTKVCGIDHTVCEFIRQLIARIRTTIEVIRLKTGFTRTVDCEGRGRVGFLRAGKLLLNYGFVFWVNKLFIEKQKVNTDKFFRIF
jgi:hypothetical protein